jgi:hypothetical protein
MNEEQEEIQHYVKIFNDLFLISIKVVKKVFWLLLLLMLCFQIGLHIPSLRIYISSVYRMDGIPMIENNVQDW